MSHKRLAAFLVLVSLFAGCIDLTVPGEKTLFVKGEPFVLSGTAAVIDHNGPCLVWIGENGITYHLFQSTGLDIEDFDRVTTPGVTARLELATRQDLEVACQCGTIVEVESVLEVME
ncbi:MAG: hypothetical protein KAY37_10190 [Phycisphaerae bacterium]|nr:hypothetical protein [Phycisphaerae bacterium]